MTSILATNNPKIQANIQQLKLGIEMLEKIQLYIQENFDAVAGLLMEQLCYAAQVPTVEIRKSILAYKEVMSSGKKDTIETDLASIFKEKMTMIYDYIRSCLISLAARKKMDAQIVRELIKTEYSSKGFLAEMEVVQEEVEEEASWLSNYEEDDFEREYASKIEADDINDKLEV